ncbi:MAG: DUF4466 family protein, partial [Candidatus Symbiothrix sp.]|nr:DUF4466 family protein [Candidatus Symbiothrix sp.]
GQIIEFTYAMALPYGSGKIVSAQVEASIEGAAGTWMENHSYYTDPDGQVDTGVLIGDPSVNDGKITKVDFTVDTCAAALRYYYQIPEAAKGQSVSFTFSAQADNGETITYQMGPYSIAKMDMKLDLTLSSTARYISIEDMAVYSAAEAEAHPEKIDLVYVYKNYNAQGVLFLHAFAAPATDPKYLPGITLPNGVNRETKIRKGGPRDAHLAHLDKPNQPVGETVRDPQAQPEVYVDDMDLRLVDLSNQPDYILNVIENDGFWAETQDGKYKAYIYVNYLRTITGGRISMKRYTMK